MRLLRGPRPKQRPGGTRTLRPSFVPARARLLPGQSSTARGLIAVARRGRVHDPGTEPMASRPACESPAP